MKVKSTSPNYQNVKTNTSAGELEFKDGVCEMTDEQFKHFSSKRYAFMKLQPADGSDIKPQT